jgi:spermidine synthase
MMTEYSNVVDLLKPGKHQSAEISIDTPDDFTRIMATIKGMPLRRDKYCRLLVNGDIMMTDADFERITNIGFVTNAKGNCLIAGLGIGLILAPALASCTGITVVEKNTDVIEMVAKAYPDPKLTVVHADIRDWLPAKDTKYDTIYFDIWPHFNSDTNADATKLERKFKKYLVSGGWMKSWTKIACSAMGRR